jgi:hypothetical protein
MKQPPKPAQPQPDPDAQVDALLYEYYVRTGKIVPQTPEDVARAEAQDAGESVALPARLRNPDLFGEAPCDPAPHGLRFPTATPSASAQNLARAAREGGTISPGTEEKMERDRAEAERAATDKHGKPG